MSLILNGLSIHRSGKKMLDVSSEISPGEITTIMGPSGVGKSTLLDAVAGQLSRPFTMSGTISLFGVTLNSLPPHKRSVGVLYQDAMLFEHLSVGENILFAVPASHQHNMTRKEKRNLVAEQLEQVGLSEFQDRTVDTLSGGQQARVALLRTLAANPKAVLLDEPFSKLDRALRQQTREWVFSQLAQRALPALLVTHDIDDAKAAGGKIVEVAQC